MSDNKKVFPDSWDSTENNEDIFNADTVEANDDFFSTLGIEGGINKKIAKVNAISSQKDKMLVIRGFVQALNEISPLVDSIELKEGNYEKYSRELVDSFMLQGAIVKVIGDEWGIGKDDDDNKYIMSLLAKNTSKLIQEGIITNIKDKKRVLIILSLISEFAEERPYIGSLIEQDMLSEDILVNVKNALFPASLKFHSMLTDIGLKNETIYKWVKWHNNMTVNLAKDLAFNWDKTASFKDREGLFEGSITYCSVIASDVWINEFSKQLKTDLNSYDEVTLWSKLEELEKSITEFDMGYLSHEEFGMDWLKHQISTYIVNKAREYRRLESSKISVMAMELYLINEYLKRAHLAWNSASKAAMSELHEKFSSMSDEDCETWMENEGSKPMPLDLFYKELEITMESNVMEKCAILNEINLVKAAKGKLAMVWGLSDAVCKVKRT
ncbi:hypothetical protein [Psychromonas sp. SP041]|uniref:hypothetical protein n=1 Tax=Psychromonas sp. SP041 TaxID=1365007 RepID=UPI0010C785C7|nr:hypothetical protein [Psychromonas sp. SP041]